MKKSKNAKQFTASFSQKSLEIGRKIGLRRDVLPPIKIGLRKKLKFQ
ncbi:MAG: hypothetical protein IKC60_04150 [Clostridia bacterium]|nr:hypothetical protein [Clostridia bacterium]